MGAWGRCGVAGAEGRRLQLGPAIIYCNFAVFKIMQLLKYGIWNCEIITILDECVIVCLPIAFLYVFVCVFYYLGFAKLPGVTVEER